MSVLLRVVIIGAGPAGLATAIALRRAGFDVAVYERAAGPRPSGNGLTLWPNGLAALDAVGAAAAVRAVGRAAPGMTMRTGTGRVLYEASGPMMDEVGGNGIAMRRTELVRALATRLDPAAVRYGARCVGVENGPDRAVARFADGRAVSADLVVAADGIRSTVRSSAGLGRRLRHGGFTVWRATVGFRLPALPGTLSMGGDRQFGIWCLPGEQVYWFASAPARVGANRPGASRPPEEFSSWHQPIPELIAATGTDRLSVTDIHDSRPLRAWSRGRVVLVGDAAHPSLPNMGQGTSQAFEDAVWLAACLAAGATAPAALRSYEAHRRPRARAAWSQARTLARVGGWRHPAACWLRERMLSAVPVRVQQKRLRRLFAFVPPDLSDDTVEMAR